MLAVKATEEALATYNDMKLGKKVAYIIFKVVKRDIVVDITKKKTECKK
jgi:hypothetical protein